MTNRDPLRDRIPRAVLRERWGHEHIARNQRSGPSPTAPSEISVECNWTTGMNI